MTPNSLQAISATSIPPDVMIALTAGVLGSVHTTVRQRSLPRCPFPVRHNDGTF